MGGVERHHGRAHKFGINIDTDQIIPARYLVTSDPVELGKHCMEDADPEFMKRVKPGDVIVAGKNFGCGSSREHAPISIKAAGIHCVIAPTFARIFYRNAFNLGLPILECQDASEKIQDGDEVSVDLASGVITNLTRGETYQAAPIPEFMRGIVDAGGMIPYLKQKLANRPA